MNVGHFRLPVLSLFRISSSKKSRLLRHPKPPLGQTSNHHMSLLTCSCVKARSSVAQASKAFSWKRQASLIFASSHFNKKSRLLRHPKPPLGQTSNHHMSLLTCRCVKARSSVAQASKATPWKRQASLIFASSHAATSPQEVTDLV